MRFHFGFSKKVSIKTIIEIFGFLFVAFLTFFGIYDITHALTQIPMSQYDVYSYTEYDDSSFNTTSLRSGNLTKRNTGSYGYQVEPPYYNYGNTEYGGFISATTSKVPNYHLTKNLNFNINNGNDYFNTCSSETDDLKSIDFYFYVNVTDLNYNSSSFNYFNISSNFNDLFDVRISAYDMYNETYFTTSCTKTMVNDLSYLYLVSCNNVFSGNSNYNIDIYSLQIYNTLPFISMYKVSNDIDYVNLHFQIGRQSSYISPYDKTSMYECNNEKPVFDLNSNDPANFNTIYDNILDNYDVDIPGINTNLMLLNLPNSIADLLMLPFDVVKAVINNSDVCTSYDIDFSSIMRKWGDPNSSYVLSLPCMRSVLSGKLGNWYSIIDMLLCFIVFYDITMHVIALISAITSGEDLFGYFFQKSGSGNNKVKYVDSSTGEVLRNG